MSTNNYKAEFEALSLDLSAIIALLGFDSYTGVDPVLRRITDLLVSAPQNPGPRGVTCTSHPALIALDKQCHDDVARAMGLTPTAERDFAWSYLLDRLKRLVGDDDQAYDIEAERLTAEALGIGAGINPNATSMADIFLTESAGDDESRHDAVKALHDVMQAVPCASLYSLAESVLDAGYVKLVSAGGVDERAAFYAGVKAASDKVKSIVADYDERHGSTDPDTGTREYPGNGEEWVGQMLELIEDFTGIVAPADLQARAALSANHSEQVREGWRPVPITSLARIIRLIDPAPLRMPNGDTMVFKNPHAAAVLREISAEVRAMLAAAPSAGNQPGATE